MIGMALKEWAVVCDMLAEGRQTVVLRKGGIAEDAGPGRFTLDYDRFALFPAWEHQRAEGIKPAYRDRVEEFDQEPSTLTLRSFADVEHVWQVPSRRAFDQLDHLHIWDKPQVDMRFNYKPERPLYLVALRVWRLAKPKTIQMSSEYWGCRSWVPLVDADHVDETDAEPVYQQEAMQRIVNRIEHAFQADSGDDQV